MNHLWSFLFLLVLVQICIAPPVVKNPEDQNESDVGGLEDYMEYHRYLKEVVNALESDPEFRNKLEKAEEHDIRSGKIAEELEFVSHHVRTKLDEIKRIELDRLKELMQKQKELTEDFGLEDPTHRHVDHANPHTFEIEDLKKLIAKTTEDLAEADKKRRVEFKEYELQKEYEKQEKLNHTNGEEREKLEKEYKEKEEKHRKHDKLHEPGHKAQLEEVWQEQDQMQQEFDPKTFFMLHDIDSNGVWDQAEVKALFLRELDKMYSAGAPEDDVREKAEEMERMRESVFREVDLNKDNFIDFQEFLAQTKKHDFQEDHGWNGIDEQKPYTDEELQDYVRQHHENQMRQGYPDPRIHPNGLPPPGAYGHPQVPPQGYHPNAIPPQYNPQFQQHNQQPLPGHLPDLNTNEIYPNQPHLNNGQVPQMNYHHQQQQQAQYQQQVDHHKQQQANYQKQQEANYQQQQQLNYQHHQANQQNLNNHINQQPGNVAPLAQQGNIGQGIVNNQPQAQIPNNLNQVPQVNIQQPQVPNQINQQQNVQPNQVVQNNLPGNQANVPQANIPQVNAPQANIPQANVPQVNIPPANAPQANIPPANAPQANIPPANILPGNPPLASHAGGNVQLNQI